MNDESRVYLPSEIQKMLGISKGACYDFLKAVEKTQSPFRVIRINTSIRVPKEGFDLWLSQAS